MGRYYILRGLTAGRGAGAVVCSWYAPGASGGANLDGGAAVDPETGMMYVAALSGLSTIQLQKDPCSEFRYSSPRDNCGLIGALPPPPGYQAPESRGGGFERRGQMSLVGGVSLRDPRGLGRVSARDA